MHPLDVNHYVGVATHLDGRAYLNQTTSPGRVGFWKSMWIITPAPYLGCTSRRKPATPEPCRILDVAAEAVATVKQPGHPVRPRASCGSHG
ncbi:MAG: hypothetical protein JWM76_4283 [Pseudonocardiales bacterium]|nr:hypothetical protein [Pseudonocardiales bacterium]